MKLCIDLGATNIKGATVQDGKLISRAFVPCDHSCGVEGIARSLKSLIEILLTPEADAIAFASAGDIDEKGVCTYATGNLEGFTGFDFVRFSKENFSRPAVALNDAYAALLGEMCYGAGVDLKDKRVAMLTLGSGVGGAYWSDGGLFNTPQNDNARFGHIPLYEGGLLCTCGRKGCVEQYLSGRALNRRAREAGIEQEQVLGEFSAGNKNALRVMTEYCADLERALCAVHAVSPFDVCILGGGVAEGLGDCFDFFASRLSYPVRLAKLGNTAGIMGAYAFAERLL